MKREEWREIPEPGSVLKEGYKPRLVKDGAYWAGPGFTKTMGKKEKEELVREYGQFFMRMRG